MLKRILRFLLGVHKERLVLRLLDEHGDLYGLELVRLSNGKLSRGTIYVFLGRLEDKKLVSSRIAVTGRRLYAITKLGRQALKQEGAK